MTLSDYACVPLSVGHDCEWCREEAVRGQDLCEDCQAYFERDKKTMLDFIRSDAMAKEFWAHFRGIGW